MVHHDHTLSGRKRTQAWKEYTEAGKIPKDPGLRIYLQSFIRTRDRIRAGEVGTDPENGRNEGSKKR